MNSVYNSVNDDDDYDFVMVNTMMLPMAMAMTIVVTVTIIITMACLKSLTRSSNEQLNFLVDLVTIVTINNTAQPKLKLYRPKIYQLYIAV